MILVKNCDGCWLWSVVMVWSLCLEMWTDEISLKSVLDESKQIGEMYLEWPLMQQWRCINIMGNSDESVMVRIKLIFFL